MDHDDLRFPRMTALALVISMAWTGQLRAADPSTNSAQRTFSSPADATNALVEAVKAHDKEAIRGLFGPEGTNLLTGDQTLDERHFQSFASNVADRCDLVRGDNNTMILEVGRDNWPFPIPLVETNGAWVFD